MLNITEILLTDYTLQWWSSYTVARTQYAMQSTKIIIIVEVTHFVCASALHHN